MKKSKKILFSFAMLSIGVTLLSVPVIAASCTTEKIKISDIKSSENVQIDKEEKSKKSIVITDAGHVDDLSFNQSAFEGLEQISKDLGLDKATHVIPNSESEYEKVYNEALKNDFKYWITVGFKHTNAIKKFYNDHKEEMMNKGIVIIAVDFNASQPNVDSENKVIDPGIPEGYSISLEYNTKESGWVAGYASAKFLSTMSEEKRLVLSFGGGAFPGVTDFNEGYLKGILAWNQMHPETKTKHTVYSDVEKVYLQTGFVQGDKMLTHIQSALKGKGNKVPTIVLPVAGPATLTVVDNITDKQYIIGVDVDQTNVVSKRKDHFFTSITKGIGQSVYDVLEGLYSKNSEKLHGFELGKTSGHNKGNIAENWTGVAKAKLDTTENTELAQNALNEALSEFKKLSNEDKIYVSSSKAEKTGEDITSLQARLNKLVDLVNA
ncbi:BMP family ABC transporter substrate-binding protein [Mycoplasma miroungirhinis]|uniref:BMP family ABC transporter substrate-binding protein n=1 Tax=Mycoplasma miroungirhinis TaxID=754516 RepID=A0A6M4JDT4_9MOLU|nr:BMP family ABC transporter substrate-binding protein [Mycoplasma miroungirhinis]QJR44236.1 BMP family ABC transporter substrate-binding protein [Mycoplasma miroungirhinis]